MDVQRANEIQVLLEGVSLPASRETLVAYAAAEDRDAAQVLERLPDQDYDRLDEIGALLLGWAKPAAAPPPLPRAESGSPSDDYVNPAPQPGAVRDQDPPANVLAQQTKTQKKQQAKQS